MSKVRWQSVSSWCNRPCPTRSDICTCELALFNFIGESNLAVRAHSSGRSRHTELNQQLRQSERRLNSTARGQVLRIDPVLPDSIHAFNILPKGHRLSRKRVITPEDLAGEKCISFPREYDTRRIVDDIFAARQIERVMSAECQLSAAIATFVARGAGVSVIDPVSTDYMTEGVSVHDFAPAIPFEYGVVTSDRQPPSRLTCAFVDFVRERVKERTGRLRV